MGQQETEQLTRILTSAALARAVSTIAELGIADLIHAGQPQAVEHLARASKTQEAVLYRTLRFMASHGLFAETGDRHFGWKAVDYGQRGSGRQRGVVV